jgi:hypothetical protein
MATLAIVISLSQFEDLNFSLAIQIDKMGVLRFIMALDSTA